MEITADQRTISAREGLLDAVEALGPHGEAVILVGAQAVYVHTGEVDAGFAVSPFTYDADIALDPALLGNDPAVIDAILTYRATVSESELCPTLTLSRGIPSRIYEDYNCTRMCP